MARDKEGKFSETHKMSRTGVYGIWGNMLYRCNTSTCPLYESYGGRGISVCAAWHSFDSFMSDMGDRPSDSHSIDRIDVNGNYEPSNCRWATAKDQARNRRNSSFIFIDGLKLQVDEYCEKYGISKTAIKNRIRRNWTNKRIIETPVRLSNANN